MAEVVCESKERQLCMEIDWTVEYKCTKQLFYNDKSRYQEKVSECTIIDSHGRLS
ncbi:hypothetical protein DPMN_164429 [Dreissena polymorpha]|uniref:Uncharacterized protein n=1 Tax=Dreissena polymorpha TaxID=45954 RepID=A0A9D4EV46_DREPO|nr:hypothetical protein DPMN_164429 [Dreissena polymorpha]